MPEARIAIAHGQMDEGSLEKVVLDFWEGEYDVLVCTTIIESGIDMPTVNTLVVDRADLLGLGQLHQLRGRVGRSGQRAYAYLFHPRDRTLTEEAYERLKTIGEATELGSGFKIAMRDLEIRGAGNLLGTGQSGHIAAVGYDLYCQMVSEVVAELKGEEVREPAEIKLDLPLDANLPKDYVEKEELRLEAYRRLAAVTTEAEVDDIRAEWEDRYGPVPDEAVALLEVARLRAEAARLDIRELNVVKVTGIGAAVWTARMSPVKLKVSEEIRLKRLVPKGLYKADMGQLVVPVKGGRQVAADLVDLLSTLFPVKEAGVAPSVRCRFVPGGPSPYDLPRAPPPSRLPARRRLGRRPRCHGLRVDRGRRPGGRRVDLAATTSRTSSTSSTRTRRSAPRCSARSGRSSCGARTTRSAATRRSTWRRWGVQIQFMVVPGVLADEGLEITDEPIGRRSPSSSTAAAPGALDGLPDDMREQYVDGFAGFDKLQAELGDELRGDGSPPPSTPPTSRSARATGRGTPTELHGRPAHRAPARARRRRHRRRRATPPTARTCPAG